MYKSSRSRLPSNDIWKDLSQNDIKALDDLLELWEESNSLDDSFEELPSNLLNASSVSDTSAVVRCFPPPQTYKPESCYFPVLQGNPNIWAFTQQVIKEIQSTTWQKNYRLSNLSKSQQRALTTLKKNHDIIIKLADKGGNIVIMDFKKYQKMVMDILRNREWYTILGSQVQQVKINYPNLIAHAFHRAL